MPEIFPPDPVDYDDEQSQNEALKLYEDLPVISPYGWQHLTISAIQLAAEDYEEQEHLEERAKALLKKHALTPFFSMTPDELNKVVANIDALEHAYADGEPFTALLGIYILAELSDLMLDNSMSNQATEAYWHDQQKDMPVKERFLAALRKKRGYYYD